MPQYQIFFKNRNVEKCWRSYEAQMTDKMADIRKFLEENPKDRSKAPGKLKKLRGRLKQLLQYDLTASDRIWYEVVLDEKSVYIVRIGPHT
jgi:hypothetical protein